MLNEAYLNGYDLAQQAVGRIEDNLYSLQTATELIDNQLIAACKFLLNQRTSITNEYLTQMKEDYGFYGIYWYDENSEIINSDPASDIGWIPDKGHPIEVYYSSGEEMFVEAEARENATVPGEFIKSGYLRDSDGYFIQVSVSAESIKEVEAKFELQGVVENLASQESIVYAAFVNTDMIAEANSDTAQINANYSQDEGIISAIQNGAEYQETIYDNVSKQEVYRISIPVKNTDGGIAGALMLGASLKGAQDAIAQSISSTGVIALIAGVVIAVMLVVLIGNVVIAIGVTRNQLNLAAAGDFSTHLPDKFLHRRDEFGEVSNAIANMQESIHGIIKKVADSAVEVETASSELNKTSHQNFDMAKQVSAILEQVAEGAVEQAKNTEEGSESVNQLGDLIETDQRAIDNVIAAVDKIDSLKNKGLSVLRELTIKTRENDLSIQEVQEIILNTNESVNKINAASQVIEEIASQTNLLALNAAIEAARAGEAGRGFAVVSEEIRKLADESNASVAEINQVIKDLSLRSEKAVQTTKELKDSVSNQSQSVNETNIKFEGIADAIDTMQRSVSDLRKSSTEMGQQKVRMIQVMETLSAIAEENVAATEEVTATIEQQTNSIGQQVKNTDQLSELAVSLEKNIGQFKI